MIAALVALAARAAAGAPTRPGGDVCADLAELPPAFRARVELVLADMRAMGFEPMVWETYRTQERADMLAKRGTGSKRSMHRHRVAVDIICARRMWKAGRKFWRALVLCYERHGIVSGGRWSRVDLPHGQACEVREQARLRSMTYEQIEEWCSAKYEQRLAA